ncbi:MAG: HTH domain-containing protein, partial [Clostridia bacterium]|nr:HTH domain-containing protein [Clostridia bacterium]
NANKSIWFTGDEIAEKVNLTGVTVRRYMNYLAESGRVVSEMNYETGGRPCMKYKVE